MYRIIVYLVVGLMSLMLKAQVSENRQVGSFSKLKVSNSIDVFYTFSTNQSIKVYTDDAQKMACIKTEVANDVLKIYIETKGYSENTKKKKAKGGNNWNNGVSFKVLKVEISGPYLSEITTSAAAEVKLLNPNKIKEVTLKSSSASSIEGSFEVEKMTVDTSSSSDCILQVDAKTVEIESSSSSDVKISGKAEIVEVNSSSSSDCDLKNLQTKEAYVKASSSADVMVSPTILLNAEATSSADVIYYGTPDKISVKESSSGSVTKK